MKRRVGPFEGIDTGHKRKILDYVHDGIPQKVVRPNQHLPNLPVAEEDQSVKLEVKNEEELDEDEKTTSELALALIRTGRHVVNETLETSSVPFSPAQTNNARKSDSVKTSDLSNDLKLSDTESIQSSKEENKFNIKPNVNEILAARLE